MWRLRLDTVAKRMALEVRDTDLLLAEFYTMELSRNELSKLPLPAAKNWWLGLEDANEGLLFLHGYGNRQLGQHKGIMAYSASDGALQWEQPDCAFYGVTADGTLALDLQEQTLILLNTQSGSILAQNISVETGASAVAEYNAIRNKACIYPMLYLEGEEYFAEVCDFLMPQLQVKPVRGMEYAETDSNIFISYYTETAEGGLDNVLIVFGLNGELQLQQTIASGLNGIGSDTFIIFNHNLYFIRQRSILVVYSLI